MAPGGDDGDTVAPGGDGEDTVAVCPWLWGGVGRGRTDHPVESYPAVSTGVPSVPMPSPVLPAVAGRVRKCDRAQLDVLCSHATLPATCLSHFLPGRQPGSRVLLGAERRRRCQDPRQSRKQRAVRGWPSAAPVPAGRGGAQGPRWEHRGDPFLQGEGFKHEPPQLAALI